MAVAARSPAGVALRLRLHGRVQGLGVRPAVARLAQSLGLAGSVRNTLDGLEIEVEGTACDVAAFEAGLLDSLPPGCDVRQVDATPARAIGRHEFVIERDAADGPLTTRVPPDTAVCAECLAEHDDPGDRRAGYPLIACAACGPRYSAIRSMPYEREQTTLAGFRPCDNCEAEYVSPSDRRYHAQTIACRDCGPQVWAVDGAGRNVGAHDRAIAAAVAALRDGRIVALRGFGGYQLLCDARSETAVQRLRARKRRPAKPLAVMVETFAEAERLAQVNPAERRMLHDPANPIVLLTRRAAAQLAPSVHPGLDTVGVLLPTTAFHVKLLRGMSGPLVCTSANREGEPLEYEIDTAERNLSGVADLWLHHDRPIARPIDDSVVRIIAGRPVTLRLARGLAPLALDLPAGAPVLALGGHQKSAAAWCNGAQCVLGAYLGDLESLAARERFIAQLDGIRQLYRFAPQACAHDLHPDYFTTRWAAESGLRTSGVQHHVAHVAAGMLEHGLLDAPVLGIAWDGTGWGTDGTIWGSECFTMAGVASAHRIAHLRPFMLPGGEAAIREPWRIAVSLLAEAVGCEELQRRRMTGVDQRQVTAVLTLSTRRQLNVVTTSAGRLFDAAAALILGLVHAQFDGEPAMRLEAAADRSAPGTYPLPLTDEQPQQFDWRLLIAALWADCCNRVAPGAMAMRFHRGIAKGLAALIREHAGLPVVFGGGVFQSRLLAELLVDELNDDSRLRLPGRIPPNDGGLAAGQLAIALAAGHTHH